MLVLLLRPAKASLTEETSCRRGGPLPPCLSALASHCPPAIALPALPWHLQAYRHHSTLPSGPRSALPCCLQAWARWLWWCWRGSWAPINTTPPCRIAAAAQPWLASSRSWRPAHGHTCRPLAPPGAPAAPAAERDSHAGSSRRPVVAAAAVAAPPPPPAAAAWPPPPNARSGTAAAGSTARSRRHPSSESSRCWAAAAARRRPAAPRPAPTRRRPRRRQRKRCPPAAPCRTWTSASCSWS